MISQLYLWSRRALYLGRSVDTAIHTHHAVQLSIGLDGPLRIDKGSGVDQLLPAVVVNREISHSLQAQGEWLASIYLEPESDDYERMVNYYWGEPGSGIKVPDVQSSIQKQFIELLRTGINPDIAQSLLRKVIEPTAVTDDHPLDPRIINVLKHLQDGPGLNVPVAELAHYVSLSPVRLTHLFKQEIGIPIRRFVLWQKLRMAAGAACQGESLTNAAQEGGFTDSAHFTHSFQKLLGINPSFLFSPRNQLSVYVEKDFRGLGSP